MIAIRAATYGPSVVMRVSDQVGTVSVGKYSDVIAEVYRPATERGPGYQTRTTDKPGDPKWVT